MITIGNNINIFFICYAQTIETIKTIEKLCFSRRRNIKMEKMRCWHLGSPSADAPETKIY